MGCREWKRKPRAERTRPNFKTHFSYEVKEYRKEQGDTAKYHYIANAANQTIVDVQAEFKALANSMIKEFKEAISSKQETIKEPVYVEHAHNIQ